MRGVSQARTDVSAIESEKPAQKLRLGGMALRNGLLVHGPQHWAVGLRRGDGSIKVASGTKPRFEGRAAQLPGLRGVLRLGEAFALLPIVKRRVPEVQLPFEDVKVAVSMVAASALAAGIKRSKLGSTGRESAVAVLSIAPTAIALKDSDLAAYHGVEHKAIAAYEQDADAADTPKEHERCGSNLVAPMMISSVAGNALARALLGRRGPVVNAIVTLGSAAVAVEIFAWSERHKESRVAQALKMPGTEMQRLFATREPTDEQLQVGRAALTEILRVERPSAHTS